MKKYLMIFGLMIIALIFPISSIKADFSTTLNTGEELTFADLPVSEEEEFIILKNIENEYLLFSHSDSNRTFGLRYASSTYFSLEYNRIESIDNEDTYKVYKYVDNVWVDNTSSDIFKGHCTASCYWLYSNSLAYRTNLDRRFVQVVFSTQDLIFKSGSSSSCNFLSDSNFDITTFNADDVVYYADELIKFEYLTYSSSFANDLEGNEIYNIRFNANNYNSNYQYLIKTSQETEWTNITENLNNEAFQYDYIIKYNTTLYMQVLDTNNSVLEAKTYTITDLEEYGFTITHNLAEDLNTRPVYAVRVDSRLVYNENYIYQYTYDGQTYYSMEIVDNVYIMNHALNIPIIYRILDANNNTIYTQVYSPDFSEMEKSIDFSESTNIVDSEKRITIGVDFTEYLKFHDMYNFRVFVNGVEYNLQDAFYIEFISTESNYIKSLDIKLMLDNMTIEEYTYRVGTINGTGGGSDTDFDGMYDNILENELENELKQQDYSTIPGMVEAVKSFIKATGDFITTFFELIMYFFNKLNVWIKTCVIALFIELVIFKTIKVVRK